MKEWLWGRGQESGDRGKIMVDGLENNRGGDKMIKEGR